MSELHFNKQQRKQLQNQQNNYNNKNALDEEQLNEFNPLKSQQLSKSKINQNQQDSKEDSLKSEELGKINIIQKQQDMKIDPFGSDLIQNQELQYSKVMAIQSVIIPLQSKFSLHQLYPSLVKEYSSKQKGKNPQKFSQYLNKQIQQMKLNQNSTNYKYKQFNMAEMLNSPIFRTNSYPSVNSQGYHPEFSSLNLSRSYIPNFTGLMPNVLEQQFSKAAVEGRLKQIFYYYAETYLQPTKNYQTFDSVKNRILNFQAFCLFAKDFKILKVVFTIDTIKKVFKKFSQFGKTLKLINFYDVIQSLAHEKDAINYFKSQQAAYSMNNQTKIQLQKQNFYSYLGIYEDKKYRSKFSKVFHDFNCQNDVSPNKIKYMYRKFSEPQLHTKALRQSKFKKKEKKLIVLKSNQKLQHSQFQQAKSIVISWQMFRSKSVANNISSLKKSSQAAKKYVKQDPQDKIFLKQYNDNKKKIQRQLIEKKIKQIQEIEDSKANNIIARIDKRIKNVNKKI